jgi:hypothetical protein
MLDSQVFLCYSHQDWVWKDRLVAHLRPLEKAGLLSVWHDDKLRAGTEWLREIEGALSSARVALLLISADFLGSDFILQKEIPEILERRKREGLAVIPVITRSCLWDKIVWLASMQVRPLYGKPLADHRGNQRDTQLSAIAAEVMGFLDAGTTFLQEGELRTDRKISAPAQGYSDILRVKPLEDNIDTFLNGAQVTSTLEGFVLNSGRFLERYLHMSKLQDVYIGHVRFIVPTDDAISAAYKNKPRSQKRYLSDTIRHIKVAWDRLESQSIVERVEFRRINCVPRNLCVIQNRRLVLTGLYELDHNHPLGLTCQKSWFHDSSLHSRELCQNYGEWFDALWEESSPMP